MCCVYLSERQNSILVYTNSNTAFLSLHAEFALLNPNRLFENCDKKKLTFLSFSLPETERISN